MINNSKNPLSAAMGGLGLPSTNGFPMLGNPTIKQNPVVGKIKSSKMATMTARLPNVERNAARVIIDSMSDAYTVPFTDDDFLVINFLDEDGTYANGKFSEKIQNRLACWEIHYLIRTVPSVYFDGGALEDEVVANLATDYDEYELRYTHQSYCDHSELKILIRNILMSFLDPRTHLIAAEAKIIPRNLKDFMKEHGGFKSPIGPQDEIEIDYYWDPEIHRNWNFLDRPLTSTAPSLEYWRTLNGTANK